jgi:hypothetical protein
MSYSLLSGQSRDWTLDEEQVHNKIIYSQAFEFESNCMDDEQGWVEEINHQ